MGWCLFYNSKYLRKGSRYRKQKMALSTTVSPTLDEKNGKLWSTSLRVYAADVCAPKNEPANALAFARWCCSERNFDPLKCLPTQTYGTRRPHVWLCPKLLVICVRRIYVLATWYKICQSMNSKWWAVCMDMETLTLHWWYIDISQQLHIYNYSPVSYVRLWTSH